MKKAPANAPAKLTPMMEQYFEVKNSIPPGTLLLFRLGDFYELFYDDAVEASKLLGLTLTKRQNYPMAGLPYHAADNYLTKLLAAGKKVAICDQQEPAQTGKLVRRQLTRILTPGTTLSPNQLDATRNHYLCALNLDKHGLHAAWLDLSTAEFKIATDKNPAQLLPLLASIDPAEIILPENTLAAWKTAPHDQTTLHALHHFCANRIHSELPAYHFEPTTGARITQQTLGVLNLQGYGIPDRHPALGPAGALLHYTTENLRAKPANLRQIQEYRTQETLLLDPATLRNLEIFQSINNNPATTLLAAINRTRTPLGARLLENWLAAPTLHIPEIQRRSNTIALFLQNPAQLADLREQLTHIRDLHRILGRLQNRQRNPRDLGAIRDTLAQIPQIQEILTQLTPGTPPPPSPSPGGSAADSAAKQPISNLPSPISHHFPSPVNTPTQPGGDDVHLVVTAQSAVPFQIPKSQIQNHFPFPDLTQLYQHLNAALADELPNDLADGNYIRTGHDPELDRLRTLATGNKNWLSELERAEQERTGIRSLKVKYTGNFGYYIEVTKANLHLVPPDYIRRQTTVGGERYVTEDLRKKEKEIFHAEENTLAREQHLFTRLLADTLDNSLDLARLADTLAQLDLLAGLAHLAREQNYCQPTIDDTDVLEITEGRHPVVEQMLKTPGATHDTPTFVPNDTQLSSTAAQIALITGPNMAGKSTYIRQVALITLLAQIGSWVPATSCRIGLVDRIFSRVGASDDLARGNSTFMVEMNETANILNNATANSLIILDEIGRGTSTYDGLSIAWAVVEHLHADPERGPRTLFATHYQELTQLEKHLPRLKNYSVAVKEWNDDILFIRRVVQGAADRSYGIQVARLAGLPLSVIDRAKTILSKLESDDATITLTAPQPKSRPKKKITIEDNTQQLNLL